MTDHPHNCVTRCADAVNTISAVEFDQSGQFLATGDVSGRVCVYKAANAAPSSAVGRVSASPAPIL